MLVGQTKLLIKIDKQIEKGFPPFTIITGQKGSGKKLISKEIAKRLHAHFIISEIKIDNIRSIIQLAHNQQSPTLYLIPDVDKMSIGAKNSLLKITEEPPKNAYFIMAIENINNTLPTLISRAYMIEMDLYTNDELIQYTNKHTIEFCLNENTEEIIKSICTCPGECNILATYDIQDFYNHCKKLVDKISAINPANLFKITQKLKFKEEDADKWDLNLFMNCIKSIIYKTKILHSEATAMQQYQDTIIATSKYQHELTINGINKQATIDIYLLTLIEIWGL
jgi:DNA polymerase III delta prime subunit